MCEEIDETESQIQEIDETAPQILLESSTQTPSNPTSVEEEKEPECSNGELVGYICFLGIFLYAFFSSGP